MSLIEHNIIISCPNCREIIEAKLSSGKMLHYCPRCKTGIEFEWDEDNNKNSEVDAPVYSFDEVRVPSQGESKPSNPRFDFKQRDKFISREFLVSNEAKDTTETRKPLPIKKPETLQNMQVMPRHTRYRPPVLTGGEHGVGHSERHSERHNHVYKHENEGSWKKVVFGATGATLVITMVGMIYLMYFSGRIGRGSVKTDINYQDSELANKDGIVETSARKDMAQAKRDSDSSSPFGLRRGKVGSDNRDTKEFKIKLAKDVNTESGVAKSEQNKLVEATSQATQTPNAPEASTKVVRNDFWGKYKNKLSFADERIADERITDERIADERIADERIADESSENNASKLAKTINETGTKTASKITQLSKPINKSGIQETKFAKPVKRFEIQQAKAIDLKTLRANKLETKTLSFRDDKLDSFEIPNQQDKIDEIKQQYAGKPFASEKTLIHQFLSAKTWQQRIRLANISDKTIEQNARKYHTLRGYQSCQPIGIDYHSVQKNDVGEEIYVFFARTKEVPRGFHILLKKEDGRYKIDWASFEEFHNGFLKRFFEGDFGSSATLRLAISRKANFLSEDMSRNDNYEFFTLSVPVFNAKKIDAFIPKDSYLSSQIKDKIFWNKTYYVIATLTLKASPMRKNTNVIEISNIKDIKSDYSGFVDYQKLDIEY